MKIFTIIKILTLGVVAQIVLVGSLGLITNDDRVFAGYMPWFWIGEWLLPSTGPGGHAMVLRGLLGAAFGFLVYAVLIGYALHRLIMSRVGDRS